MPRRAHPHPAADDRRRGGRAHDGVRRRAQSNYRTRAHATVRAAGHHRGRELVVVRQSEAARPILAAFVHWPIVPVL